MARHPRRHRLDVYDVELRLATDTSQWKRLARELSFLDESSPEAAGLSQYAMWEPADGGPRQPYLVLWVDPRQSPELPALVDTIAHEAVHGASQILHAVGHDIRGNDGNDEPHAYLTGWLTRWMWVGLMGTG